MPVYSYLDFVGNSWIQNEVERRVGRMVKEIMAALPFLDNEVYVLYDLSLLCNTSVEDLKSRCANVLKGLLEIMNGEKEVVYKVSKIRDLNTLQLPNESVA